MESLPNNSWTNIRFYFIKTSEAVGATDQVILLPLLFIGSNGLGGSVMLESQRWEATTAMPTVFLPQWQLKSEREKAMGQADVDAVEQVGFGGGTKYGQV